MNTIHKLFKTAGAIGLSCVCLTSEANPETMTLEELRVFLRKQRDETEKCRTWIDKEIKEINATGAGDGKCMHRVEQVCKENKKGGILNITYDSYGVPCSIETVGRVGLNLYDAIDPEQSPRFEYMKKRCDDFSSVLEKISKELTAEELKKRDATNTEELRGVASIRKITFNSILSSDFFDEGSRAQGKQWCSDRGKLEEAIDAYAEKVAILKYLPVKHISYNEPDIVYGYDAGTKKMTMKVKLGKSTWGTPNHFIYKLLGEPLEQKRKLLKKTLKGMLEYKNGREKVILLLLLDKKTPLEYCLEWVDGRRAEYLYNVNRITLKFDDENDRKFLSHEIGHYLQVHLGLRQTFKDYESVFAKKLLLLKSPFENNDNVFHVPEALRSLFAEFEKRIGDVPETLTRNDLFMRWQLASRWNHPWEISNILGVYFEQDVVYMCVLSDICEQQCIRYGHAYRDGVYKNGDGEYKVRNENHEDIFGGLVRETAEQKPNDEILKFLCKLHGISFGEIVDSFKATSEAEFDKLKTLYNVFRASN